MYLATPRPMVVKRHHHNMNLLITLVTAGLWIPCWMLITWDINRQNKRERERYARESLEYDLRYQEAMRLRA